jgi:hypothetical protein
MFTAKNMSWYCNSNLLIALTASLLIISSTCQIYGQAQHAPSSPVASEQNTPESLTNEAKRALYEDKNYDRTVELLRKAISINPDDAGVKYDPADFRKQTIDAPRHGREQVSKMLTDRPLMNTYIDQSDDLAVDCFQIWRQNYWKSN